MRRTMQSCGRRSCRRLVPLVCLLAGLIVGCAHGPAVPPGYYGLTEPMDKVIQQINANNQAIPTLFARHEMSGDFKDPQTGESHFVNATGDVYLIKPKQFWVRGKKDVLGDIFELGSMADRYWMADYAGAKTMWWGWYRNVGKPCAEGMPIRPDLLLEVLGIGNIDIDFTKSPVPVMRFNNDLDVYMFVWSEPLPDRWFATREIWYSRKTLAPVKVLLFDRNGRIVLRANLTEPQPVQAAGVEEARWPKMATRYDLFFPETKSTMELKLSGMALTSKTGQPKEGLIEFPDKPDVAKTVQIDKDCDQ